MWNIRSLDSCYRGAIFFLHQNSVRLLQQFVYYCCSVWLIVESLNLTVWQECCGMGTGLLTSPQGDGCRALYTFYQYMHELVTCTVSSHCNSSNCITAFWNLNIYEYLLCRYSFKHHNSIFNPFLTGKHTDYIISKHQTGFAPVISVFLGFINCPIIERMSCPP